MKFAVLALYVAQCVADPSNGADDQDHVLSHGGGPNLAKCKSYKPASPPPKKVDDVRIQDVDVVLCMGDSLMAGLNAAYAENEATWGTAAHLLEARGQRAQRCAGGRDVG